MYIVQGVGQYRNVAGSQQVREVRNLYLDMIAWPQVAAGNLKMRALGWLSGALKNYLPGDPLDSAHSGTGEAPRQQTDVA